MTCKPNFPPNLLTELENKHKNWTRYDEAEAFHCVLKSLGKDRCNAKAERIENLFRQAAKAYQEDQSYSWDKRHELLTSYRNALEKNGHEVPGYVLDYFNKQAKTSLEWANAQELEAMREKFRQERRCAIIFRPTLH